MTSTLPTEAPAAPATPDLDAAALVARLRATFDSGKTRPLEWRREQLQALRRLLVEREDELVTALHADLGKPRLEAWLADIGYLVRDIDHTLRHLRRWTRPRRVPTPLVTKPARARLVPEPLGVVLVIAPWNYPVQLAFDPLIAAIAAGNAAVIKPSEVSAHTSNVIARLVPEYLDQDAVAVVEGAVAETTALLDQRFDHIFYTGNGRIGRVVMEAAAKHLTPVTLELGGKSPTIIDATADLEVAARRTTWGKLMNAGQTCIAPDYVLIERQVADRFVDLVRESIRTFYGDDPQQSPDFARIVNDRHFQRLVGLLESGTVVIGGEHDAATRYLAPTVLRDVAPDSPIMQEEIFGPIMPIIPVDGVDEAIRFVNERDKPLALYVFSKSSAVVDRVLAETSSGGVAVNTTMYHAAVPELPFGGVGESGLGAYHGRRGFDTFSHLKPVLRKTNRPDPDLAYPPYTAKKERLIRRFL